MNPKPALWISVGLTAFILFFTTSLMTMAAGKNSPQVAAAPAVSNADVSAQFAQREQAYRQMIDQANTQLLQAQNALAAAQGTTSTSTGSTSASITADQATAIAQGVALSGAQLSGQAELVDFQGTVAYEVRFDAGNVYVNAATGEVLSNGTIVLQPALITPEQAAQIAANYMGRTDVYRIDVVQLSGLSVYRVKFMNSDAVFVDQYGQILQVRLASTGSPSTSSHGEGEHESGGD